MIEACCGSFCLTPSLSRLHLLLDGYDGLPLVLWCFGSDGGDCRGASESCADVGLHQPIALHRWTLAARVFRTNRLRKDDAVVQVGVRCGGTLLMNKRGTLVDDLLSPTDFADKLNHATYQIFQVSSS